MTTLSHAEQSPFRIFEHAGWQDTASQYHDVLGSLTSQVIDALLDAVGAQAGVRLLDIASGPGYAAAAAVRRGAEAIGIDFAATMVAEARRRHPAVTFQEGDAEALPFPDASFDAVVMNFGLLHVEHPERALAEAHRVLRAGGRIGFTVWAPPEHAIGLAIILRAIEAHGNMQVPLPPGPPFFRFSDPEESQRVAQEAGFAHPHVTQLAQVWQLPSPQALFEATLAGTVRTAALLRAQSSEALAAIRQAMRDAASVYNQEHGCVIPMAAVLASATKP